MCKTMWSCLPALAPPCLTRAREPRIDSLHAGAWQRSCTVKLPVMPRCMISTCPPDRCASRYFAPPLQPLDLAPAQPVGETLGQGKAQVGTALVDAREACPTSAGREAAAHGLDFRQLGHRADCSLRMRSWETPAWRRVVRASLSVRPHERNSLARAAARPASAFAASPRTSAKASSTASSRPSPSATT